MATEAFLEKIIGYTMGFMLLAGCFWRWLPTVVAPQRSTE